MSDFYIEGFGTVPCVKCGHGSCTCDEEDKDDKHKKKKRELPKGV